MVKRVTGGVALLVAVIVFLLAGEGPLEGPVGLAIGVGFGSVLSVVGGILIGKSILEKID